MEQLILLGAFFFYLFSGIAFVMAVTGKASRVGEGVHVARWGRRGLVLAMAGVVLHLVFTVVRIIISGHFPTSNMFEFTAFLCFAIVVAYIVIYFLYRTTVLGAFVMPLAVIILAYAAVFPREVKPLIPALQSYWLGVHVTTVAIGEGALAVGFVAGFIYLIRWVGEGRTHTRTASFLEAVMVLLLMVVGFVILSFAFGAVDYEASFRHVVDGQRVEQQYSLPPVVAPDGGQPVKADSFPGLGKPLFEAPSWMKGEKAASKLNTVIWSMAAGLFLYGILRLVLRRRLYELLFPMVKNLDLETVDEISYRAIAIGYPIFTLGGLVFAMIWAHEAWGRFWGWDPKETWALITWLFYSAYLHLRLSRGWQGLKSSWMAVGGFIVIMINLIAINLVLAGLHSYA
ncbi:cytochrome c biogenesis protein CcsA [Salinithrix halophila]|uniref:Cytochrome c biogenesis protein CcsA n=1 Tax=Salinithrix halophila TaxID=1485204 RepID=A0ABV8JHD9_9BACL